MPSIQIDNCMDCPHHHVQRDPDPDDWFCDDDVKVVCTKAIQKDGSYREVTSACRPYNTRKECSVPQWCPLNVKAPADKKRVVDL